MSEGQAAAAVPVAAVAVTAGRCVAGRCLCLSPCLRLFLCTHKCCDRVR